MNINIESTENGYLLTTYDDSDNLEHKYVVETVETEDQDESEQRTMEEVLRLTQEYFGVFNSKHNKTRLEIEVK